MVKLRSKTCQVPQSPPLDSNPENDVPVESVETDRRRRLELLASQDRARTEFRTYFEDLERLLKAPIAEPDRRRGTNG